jgi:hypothetical protein
MISKSFFQKRFKKLPLKNIVPWKKRKVEQHIIGFNDQK